MVEMHPGAHPFEELAAALTRIATDPVPGLEERLEREDPALLRTTEEILLRDTDLLLVIDQFEELFTLAGDPARSRFIRLLHTTVTDPANRVRVVLTLRADFYDRPLFYGGMAELVKARTVTVTPLLSEELQRAVAGPAEAVSVEVAPALVAEIVADFAAQPAALPLLQYALTELCDPPKDSGPHPGKDREIGGVSGGLARRAEDLYGRLSLASREAAWQLFLRLLVLGEDGSEGTRRRVLRPELSFLEVEPEAMEAAIDAFAARRLLSFDRDPVTRGPTVEVAHEALLREWGRLRLAPKLFISRPEGTNACSNTCIFVLAHPDDLIQETPQGKLRRRLLFRGGHFLRAAVGAASYPIGQSAGGLRHGECPVLR